MYRISVLREALKSLESIPQDFREATRSRINSLSQNPRPAGAKKLHRGGYRIRQGSYRILYEVDDGNLLITITAVKHRKEAYR